MARARKKIDTFTIPVGRRRRVYPPDCNVDARNRALSTRERSYGGVATNLIDSEDRSGSLAVLLVGPRERPLYPCLRKMPNGINYFG